MTKNYKEYIERVLYRYELMGKNGITNSELLELLLCQFDSRKDIRTIAKKLSEDFGSLKKILNISQDELSTIVGKENTIGLGLVRDCITAYFEPENMETITLSSPEAVSELLQKEVNSYSEEELHSYLQAELGNQPREFFMILCLNSSNQLIYKQVLFAGTIDQAQVYPREILKIALLKNAAAIILVHNHPSGNSKPSDDDIILTKRLENIAKEFGLRIHDHIVVSGSSAFSIRANRLLD